MSEKKYDIKLNQIRGNPREGFGKVAGDKRLETEGFAERTITRGKEPASGVKESAEGAVEGVKRALHKDN